MKTKTNSVSKRRSSGFTLVEMVLVLGIVGLLIGVGVTQMGGVLVTGKKTRCKGDITSLCSAMRSYEVASGILPSTDQGIQALVEKPGGRPQPSSWTRQMDKMLVDPWGNPYNYSRPATRSKGQFDVWSSGEDGVSGNADDVGNWDL
jgi:general secretion pathway protein G